MSLSKSLLAMQSSPDLAARHEHTGLRRAMFTVASALATDARVRLTAIANTSFHATTLRIQILPGLGRPQRICSTHR